MTGELGYNVSRVDQTFVSILRQESVVDYDLVQSYLSRETSESASDRMSEYWETLCAQAASSRIGRFISFNS